MKTIKFTIFALTAIIFLAAPAVGQEEQELSRFLASIKLHSEDIQSLSCTMTQEKHLSLFNKPILFNGFLFLVRPRQLRWEFISPVPSVLMFNNNKGTRCNDDTAPVHFELASDPVMRMVAEQLWTWLDSDYTQLTDMYSITMHDPSSLFIKPKQEALADTISHIIISFHPDNMQPQQVEIYEPDGDFTRIIYSAFKLNSRLPDSLFTSCDRD